MDIFDAACNGKLKIVKKLIREGVDVNSRNENGNTILILACMYNHYNTAKFLVNSGANVNLKGNNEYTALILSDQIRLFELLLDAGADINAQDYVGNTALIRFSRIGPNEYVQYLLSRGADPDIQNNIGYTAFMFATVLGFSDIVETLIDFKADVTVTSYDGETAFDIADKHMKKIILNKLIQKDNSKGLTKRKLFTLVKGQQLPTEIYKKIGKFMIGTRKRSRKFSRHY